MCTAMIKAFTLALCGLSLWLLISMEVSKFDPHHEYLSSVSLRLQMVYSDTWILWFNRQMDLRVDIFQYHLSSHGKLGKMDKVFCSFDPSQDPICPNCHLQEHDLHLWLCECPALITMRFRVFGYHQGSLEWLATRPGDVVSYARKTLVNLDA